MYMAWYNNDVNIIVADRHFWVADQCAKKKCWIKHNFQALLKNISIIKRAIFAFNFTNSSASTLLIYR